mgnify:CR=1 FL=1
MTYNKYLYEVAAIQPRHSPPRVLQDVSLIGKSYQKGKIIDSKGQNLYFMTHWCLSQKEGIYL